MKEPLFCDNRDFSFLVLKNEGVGDGKIFPSASQEWRGHKTMLSAPLVALFPLFISLHFLPQTVIKAPENDTGIGFVNDGTASFL